MIEFDSRNDPSWDALDDISVTSGIQITSLSTKTFVTTDSITLQASTGVPQAGTQVTWTVQGQGAASGINGFPTNFVTTTDATGTATFTFTPSDNTALANDRHTTWTAGSLTANPAISFDVTASTVINGVTYSDSLSDTNLGPLQQDETDILRQEYYDYNIPVPARSQVVPSLGAGYNSGNYGVQLSVDLPGHYNSVLAAYHGQAVTVTINGVPYQTTIPNTAPVTISSGYRDPQHNKAIGSVVPDSNHTRGRALDLVPSAVQVIVMVNGQPMRVTLGLHTVLYPALDRAALTVGTAFAEHNATPVAVGDTSENHIHVQWT